MMRTHAPDARSDDLAEGVVVVRSEVSYRAPLTFRFQPGEHRVLGDRAARRVVHHGLRGLRRARRRADDVPAGQDRAHAVRLRHRAPAPAHPRRACRPSRAFLEPDDSRRRGPRRPRTRRRAMDAHYPVQVRFSDVDVYGHVNNVKYFEYFQEGRIALLAWLAARRSTRGARRRRWSWRRPTWTTACRSCSAPSPTTCGRGSAHLGDHVDDRRVRDPRRRRGAVPGAGDAGVLGPRRPAARSSPSSVERELLSPRVTSGARLTRSGDVLNGVDHGLRGVDGVAPRTARPARGSARRRRARRGSARSQCSLASGVTANGACRIRSRGWPRVSEYVVGPPQYCARNRVSRSSAGPRSSSG